MPYQLYLSRHDWERLPERLADPVLAGIAEANRRALAAIRARPEGIRGRLPNRLDQDGPDCGYWWRSHRVVLERCLVAWRLGDAQALPDALTCLDALLDQRDWGFHYHGCHLAHADLKTGELASLCALALDALHDELGPERRQRLAGRCVERLLQPYLAGIAGGDWWRRAEFNWGPAVHGPCGVLALALRDGQPELSRRVLAAVREGLDYAREDIRGGGWIEGMMYGATHIGGLCELGAALHAATGDDLGLGCDRDLAALMDGRPAQVAPDGGLFNFSGATAHTVESWMPGAYWLAERHRRPEWTAFEDGRIKPWWDAHGIFNDVSAFWLRPVRPPLAQPLVPRTARLRAIDWLTWRGDRAWLALRGGTNGGNRCNRDLGAFILGAGQDRFLMDPGWGEVPSVRHSVVTVRGAEQAVATGSIVRHRDRPDWFFAALDLGACYPAVLAYHHRFVLAIDEREVLLLDDLLGRAGGRVGARFHLQTALPVARTADGFTLAGAGAALHARLPPHASWEVVERGDAEAQRPYRTLTWTCDIDRPRCLHPVRLGIGAPPTMTWERDGDVLTIACRGRRWRLELDALTCEQLP